MTYLDLCSARAAGRGEAKLDPGREPGRQAHALPLTEAEVLKMRKPPLAPGQRERWCEEWLRGLAAHGGHAV